MSANHPTLDPEPPQGDGFLDAVLAVEHMVRQLGEAIDGAPGDPAPADGSDHLLDALLGLVSLRKTVALILAAAATDLADAARPDDAAWSRELLR